MILVRLSVKMGSNEIVTMINMAPSNSEFVNLRNSFSELKPRLHVIQNYDYKVNQLHCIYFVINYDS